MSIFLYIFSHKSCVCLTVLVFVYFRQPWWKNLSDVMVWRTSQVCTLSYIQIDEMTSKLYWIKTQPDEMILVIFKQVNLSLPKALFCESRYIHLPKLGFPISSKIVISRKTKQNGADHCFVGIPPVSRSESYHGTEKTPEFCYKSFRGLVRGAAVYGGSCNACTLKRCITFRTITNQTMLLNIVIILCTPN
jgi:hypothetical protein